MGQNPSRAVKIEIPVKLLMNREEEREASRREREREREKLEIQKTECKRVFDDVQCHVCSLFTAELR